MTDTPSQVVGTPLRIPALAPVALIGASGVGQSTFAARHCRPYEVISSDPYLPLLHI